MSPVVALWQGAGVAGTPGATLAEARRAAREAAAAGAALLVFPEGYLTGYHLPGLGPERLGWVGDALAEVAGIAREAGIALVMGTHLAEGARLGNAAVAFGPDGAELGRYAKRALYGGWERATFAPGTAPLRIACAGLRVGVLICYDVEFPELVRAEAAAGCDLVVVPTALMSPHERIACQLVAVRAMENQIFLAYANRTGAEAGLRYPGLSRICGPEGEILAEAGAAPGLLTAPLPPARIAAARAESCYLDDLARLPAGEVPFPRGCYPSAHARPSDTE